MVLDTKNGVMAHSTVGSIPGLLVEITPDIAPGLQVIFNEDMTLIRNRLLKKGTFPEDKLDLVQREYRRWLTVVKFGIVGQIAMASDLVDEFWENHFAYMERYIEFSMKAFGYLLIHRPVDEEYALPPDAMNNFWYGYNLLWGPPPPEIWGRDGTSGCCHECRSASMQLTSLIFNR